MPTFKWIPGKVHIQEDNVTGFSFGGAPQQKECQIYEMNYIIYFIKIQQIIEETSILSSFEIFCDSGCQRIQRRAKKIRDKFLFFIKKRTVNSPILIYC